MNRLICRLLGHDVWTESDEDGPYQHECVRCGWTHPWHGYGAATASARPERWPTELVETAWAGSARSFQSPQRRDLATTRKRSAS